MALRWFDGFRRGLGMYDFNNAADVNSAFGRDNGVDSYGIWMQFSVSRVRKFVPAAQTMVAGIAFWLDQAAVTWDILSFQEGSGGTHVVVRYNTTTFKLEVYRGDGTLLGMSGAIAAALGEWFYVEAKVTVSDSVGAVELRNYGNTILSLSGIDTRNGGAVGTIDCVEVGPAAKHGDDFYILDTSGATNNDFLATAPPSATTPRVIDPLPSAAGDSTQWTPHGAASNWDCVNDDSVDDDSSYVSSSTVGQLDLYQMSNLPSLSGASVRGVLQWMRARKDDATTRAVAQAMKSGATTSLDSDMVLSTSYANRYRILETDPNTSAPWTEAAVNAVQGGQKVTV